MNVSLEFPWERYAVISEIASQLEARGRPLGKTALQKFVYFLQELKDVDVGYEFLLYTYGPFSAQLMQELDITEAMGGVDVDYDPQYNAYSIRPGQKPEAIRRRADEFLRNAGPALEAILDDFGHYGARDLEIRATIVYAERDAKRRGEVLNEGQLRDTVYEIKPHFNPSEIRAAVTELRSKGYIRTEA